MAIRPYNILSNKLSAVMLRPYRYLTKKPGPKRLFLLPKINLN
ncbi:hypothetical protein [Planktothricoides raciborskii]|nr:hypothetical protein [Planktothricoides raciborskii]